MGRDPPSILDKIIIYQSVGSPEQHVNRLDLARVPTANHMFFSLQVCGFILLAVFPTSALNESLLLASIIQVFLQVFFVDGIRFATGAINP